MPLSVTVAMRIVHACPSLSLSRPLHLIAAPSTLENSMWAPKSVDARSTAHAVHMHRHVDGQRTNTATRGQLLHTAYANCDIVGYKCIAPCRVFFWGEANLRETTISV